MDQPPRTGIAENRVTLLACILGSAAVFLDGTLVNVALPAIRADLHGGLATQEWVVDGYLLTLGALLLVGGSLGDLFGRRRVFATGVTGFGIASLACAAAPDAALLVVARAVQGAAGALLVPSTLALIIDTFADDQRAAAIGSWTAWTGIATVAGPLLGGSLVELGSWRLIFIVNLPLVALTLILIRRVPSRPSVVRAKVDWVGGVLGALTLGGPMLGLIEQPTVGWGNVEVWGGLLLGAVMAAAFLLWERRVTPPMLPLGLFAVRNFRVGNISTLAFYGALNIATFVLVVFLQQVGGYRPISAGLALMPVSILTFALAKRFGALADRIGPRLLMGCGPILAAIGLLLLSRIGGHPRYLPDVLPGVTVFGLGLAATVAPLTAAVLGAVGDEHSGVASAVNNAVARVAGLVAIAGVGALLASAFSTGVDGRLAPVAVGSRPVTSGTSSVRSHESVTFAQAVARARSRPLVIDVSGFPPGVRPVASRALVAASVDALRLSLEVAALLAFLAGCGSLLGIRNPKRAVSAEDCPGGAICGASVEVGQRVASSSAGQLLPDVQAAVRG